MAESATHDTLSSQGESTFRSSGVKRKLEHALDSLDSAIIPRNVSINSDLAPRKLPKTVYSSLRRTSFSSDHVDPSITSTPTLSSIISRSPLSRTNTLTTAARLSEPSASDYSPSSLPSFLSRLSTYKLSTYTTKPSCVDAVSAAQAGWINEGKDRLVCCVCHASFVIASRTGLTREAASKLLEKQTQGLVENHKSGCPWRTRQCDRSIYRVPLKTPMAMVADIRIRAEEIQQMLDGNSFQVKDPLTEEQRAALFSLAFPEASTLESSMCIIVSLFGWTVAPRGPRVAALSASRAGSASRSASPHPQRSASPLPLSQRRQYGSSASINAAPFGSSSGRRDSSHHTGESISSILPRSASASNIAGLTSSAQMDLGSSSNKVVSCSLCQRRVGIWAFMSSKPLTSNGTDAAPADKAAVGRSFDVLAEHRSHCPFAVAATAWSAAPSQDAGEASAARQEGWRTVLDVVLRHNMGSRVKNLIPGGEPAVNDSVLKSMVDSVKSNGGNELLLYMRSLLR